MFEKSSTWQRVASGRSSVIGINLGYVPELEDDAEEKRRRNIAIAVALGFHLVLFLVSFPHLGLRRDLRGPERPVFVVRQVRFMPPAPARQQTVPDRKRRKVPVPDPTPDDPEPILADEPEIQLDVDVTSIDLGLDFAEGPPIPGPAGPGPVQVGGDVLAPVKIFSPAPVYTEDARQGHVQGVVILEAIIDALGNVSQVKVLKGLPLGLTESAVDTAKTWKFQPATRNGEPVAVFFNLTIRFSLQ